MENVAATGIEAGYQTMDVLATLLFGFIILKSAQAKGYTKAKAQIRVVSGASWWRASACWWSIWV